MEKSVGLKLRSAENDWRRMSPDTDTKKETKEMRQRKWNKHIGCYFLSYTLPF